MCEPTAPATIDATINANLGAETLNSTSTRCPKGTRRDKRTGKCVPPNNPVNPTIIVPDITAVTDDATKGLKLTVLLHNNNGTSTVVGIFSEPDKAMHHQHRLAMNRIFDLCKGKCNIREKYENDYPTIIAEYTLAFGLIIDPELPEFKT